MQRTHSQRATRSLFYSSVLRFAFLVFFLGIVPTMGVRTILDGLTLHPDDLFYLDLVDYVILGQICLSTILICWYALSHHAAVARSLAPVTRLAQVGEMTARVAHDIRSPLSGIRSVLRYLQNLQDTSVTPYADLLELSSNRLEQITKDLLDKYQGHEESQSFNLHEKLDELVGELFSQDIYAKVFCVKSYAREPIYLRGRHSKITRVFSNLIVNAVEAMNHRGKVRIRTRRLKDTAIISILDDGVGLSEEKMAQILSGELKQGKKGGHGIGLGYVKEVLKEHNGRMSIRSRLGDGACFRVELPRETRAKRRFELSVVAGEPVIVIDDDPSMLAEWTQRLKAKGITVVGFSCYEAFLESSNKLAAKSTVIVDHTFKNSAINGLEIIDRLRTAGFQSLYLCTGDYWKPFLKKSARSRRISVCAKPLPEIGVHFTHKPDSTPHANVIQLTPRPVSNQGVTESS